MTDASKFSNPRLLRALIVLLIAFGHCAADAFEQDQRINALTLQSGTDTFATQNAFGHAFTSTVFPQLQQPLTQSVNDGSTSLLFAMPGLTDLTGTNQAVLNVGVVNGAPVLPSNNPTTYSGASDLDWLYTKNVLEVDVQGVPLSQLSGTIVSKILTAGPGRILLGVPLSGNSQFAMSSTVIKASIGASSAPLVSTNGYPPGHLPSENIDPQLMSFASMSSGQMKGNISAASLAATPVPASLQAGGATALTPPYTANNSLLDVLISGGKVLGGLVTAVNVTQPDTVDPGAPVAGAGPPYTFTADPNTHIVNGCKDKNGASVNLSAGLQAATYSSYYTFTTDRVIIRSSAPVIAVEQPAGTNIANGGSKDFGSVNIGANANLTFIIKNTGTTNLTGLGITIDGTDMTMFSVTASPTAPVSGPSGSTTFTVQFAPTGTGAKTAALHIASNDTGNNPFNITLTGTANGAPKIVVEQPAGTNIANGGSKDFGTVNVGTNASLTFTIKNTGTTNLTGLGITIDGADMAMFSVTASPTSPVSGPSGSTTFTVQFAPAGTGAKTAALHIASNDTGNNPFNVTLTGTTNGAPTDIALSPATIAENQPIGTTVGTLTSTDPDAGNTFTYTLVSGTGSDDNASFTIASGNALTSAASFNFATKNTYLIRVRSTDQGGLFVEKPFTILVANGSPPVFTSNPSATPNPAFVNQAVSFSAAVTSLTAVAISWDFGDSITQTGANVTHTYGAAGMYNVTVTAQNNASTATKSFSVNVLDAQSISTKKASVSFNFKTHLDSLTLACPITLPANFSPGGKTISVTIGGYAMTQMLTSKGKTSTDSTNVFALTGKLKKGIFTSPTATLTLTLKKQNLFDSLSRFGFTSATVKTAVSVQISALVIVDGHACNTQPVFSYTAKAGVSGKGKFIP